MALDAGWTPDGRGRRGALGPVDGAASRRLRAAARTSRPTRAPGLRLDVVAAALATGADVVGSHETAAARARAAAVPALRPVRRSLSRVRAPSGSRPGQTVARSSWCRRCRRSTERTCTARSSPRRPGPPSTWRARDRRCRRSSSSTARCAHGVTRAGAARRCSTDCRGWPGSRRARGSWRRLRRRPGGVGARVGRALADAPGRAAGAGPAGASCSDVDGPIGRTDFLWAATCGRSARPTASASTGLHDGTADFAALRAEKLREDRLRDAGWEVFRFTWDEAVHRPVVIEQRARRAFAASVGRSRRPVAPAPTSARAR